MNHAQGEEMMIGRRAGVAAFLLLLSGITLRAQVPTEAPPYAVFRSTTGLRQISVIVEDKQGKPVAGLRREDFQLFDSGVPQQIQLFIAETPESGHRAQEPEAPNTFSNQIARSGSALSGYSAILIDSLFTDFGDPAEPGAANARLHALRALQSLPPGEKIAIYATERKLRVICEFTSDRELLARTLDRWKPSVDTVDRSSAVLGEPSSNPEDPAIVFPQMDAAQRASASHNQMDAVADHLAGILGRKNLIWLSNRFVIGPPELRKFNNAGVAVYPVNINGVTGHLDPLLYRLKDIAAQTGGVAYDMRNDIDVAIREAVDDGRISYTLGYYESGLRFPSVHRLSVRVGRPGLVLRYRSRDLVEEAAATSISDLAKALSSPIDSTRIPIKASLTQLQGGLDMHAAVNPESLELTADKDRWNGKAEFAARFTAADGSVVGKVFSQTIVLNLREESYDKAVREGGLGYHIIFSTVPTGAVQLKLLFANPVSGKIGTLTIPLTEVQAVGTKGK